MFTTPRFRRSRSCELRIKNVAFDETANRYTFEPNHVLTASVADGVKFEAISYEGWDMSIFTKD